MNVNRVTVGSTSIAGVQNIQAAAARMAQLQAQMSSGKRITTASDDPVGTVRAMHLRSTLARNDTYSASAQDALSWLSAQDTAYSQTVAALQQARTLALRGLNMGTNDAAANQALASEMDTVKANLIGIANTTYDDRPIFGGTTAGPIAYDTTGNYVGDNGTVTREVAQGVVVPVSQNGPSVFSTGSSDMFTLVQQAADALRTDPTQLAPMLDQFDAAIAQVSAMQATEGARYQQVQAAQDGLTVQGTAMQTELSGVEDVDLADMAMKLSTANTNYQAALQTTARISQLSLMDFLR